MKLSFNCTKDTYNALTQRYADFARLNTLNNSHIKFNADTFGALENDFIQKYALLSYFWLVLIFLEGCYLHIIQSYYTFFHSLKEDFLKCLTSYQNGQRAEKVFCEKVNFF